MTKTVHCEPQRRVQPAANGIARPDPCLIGIFGATGDLAFQKLIPSLAELFRAGYLPPPTVCLGIARRPWTDEQFRQHVRQAVEKHRPNALATLDRWLPNVVYQSLDLSQGEFGPLARRVAELERNTPLSGNRLFYLATEPAFFRSAIEGLARNGLIHAAGESPWSRVVIEKPFGRDLASAMDLDRHILQHLCPDQVYRIDHYLGKETVLNLMAFRFGNAIFEPLFNRTHVDHVQITMAETLGMEGSRGSYYDRAGALRDVVQNHMLQLLALIAMDAPATFKAGDISDAKRKALRSLVPLSPDDARRRVVRGQYDAGSIAGELAAAYREERGVAPDSNTETFVAMRVELESWRWAGVPFLLRAGKRLPQRLTEIAVQFHLPPLRLYNTVECEGDRCDLISAKPSVLVFRIQPDEGITLSFSTKRPGMEFVLEPVEFEFDYSDTFQQSLPDAYERLLLDALRGDSTLFMRSDELEAAWQFVTPILETWQADGAQPFLYRAGSAGPKETDELVRGCLEGWRPL